MSLVVFSIPALLILDWLLWATWAVWYRSGIISYLAWHVIMNIPVIAIAMVGLMLYVVSRRSLLEKNDSSPKMWVLGLILLFLGTYANFWNHEDFSEMVDRPMFLSYSINPGEPLASFLAVFWSSLWIITGALLIFDWLLRLPSRSVTGGIMIVAATVAFWDLSLLEVTMGGGTTQRYSYYFLGYPLHLVLSVALALLTVIGIAIIIFPFLRRRGLDK